jgi:exodeoxyribonuclease-5
VAILINMTGTPKSESGLVQDPSEHLFSIPILGSDPANYADIAARAEE